jgi:hypothetical protein
MICLRLFYLLAHYRAFGPKESGLAEWALGLYHGCRPRFLSAPIRINR